MGASASTSDASAKPAVSECSRKLVCDLSQLAGGRQLFLDITELAESVRSDPWWLFYLCILVDLIGMMSYLIFILGEFTDVFWAPVFAFFLQYMFGSKLISSLGVLEEFLWFTDILPTATLAWCTVHLDAFEPVRNFLRLEKRHSS